MSIKIYPPEWATYIQINDNTKSHYGEDKMVLQYDQMVEGRTERRGIIKFDFTQDLKPNDAVLGASLNFYVTTKYGQAFSVYIDPILRTATTAAAWAIYNTGQYWQTMGCTGALDRAYNNMATSTNNLALGWNEVTLDPAELATFRSTGKALLLDPITTNLTATSYVYIDLTTNLPFLQVQYRHSGRIINY